LTTARLPIQSSVGIAVLFSSNGRSDKTFAGECVFAPRKSAARKKNRDGYQCQLSANKVPM
jgi:hypothetical protein